MPQGCPRVLEPHLSPLEALALRSLHPSTNPTPAQYFGQRVGYLLHGAGHPVHVPRVNRESGASAAPGSPRRLPPRPTRGDPALTGTDSVFHWLTELSISLRTHPIFPRGFSPHASSHFGGAPFTSPGWPALGQLTRYDWSQGLSIIISGRDLVSCCPNLPSETPPPTWCTTSRVPKGCRYTVIGLKTCLSS